MHAAPTACVTRSRPGPRGLWRRCWQDAVGRGGDGDGQRARRHGGPPTPASQRLDGRAPRVVAPPRPPHGSRSAGIDWGSGHRPRWAQDVGGHVTGVLCLTLGFISKRHGNPGTGTVLPAPGEVPGTHGSRCPRGGRRLPAGDSRFPEGSSRCSQLRGGPTGQRECPRVRVLGPFLKVRDV